MEIELNLLPEYRKQEIVRSRKFWLVFRLEAAVIFIMIVLVVLLWSFGRILEMNLIIASSGPDSDINKLQYEKMEKFDQEFADINSRAQDILSIDKDQMFWSRILAEFDGISSDGISLDGLSMDNYTISIAGVSKSREELIAFKSDLESSRCFTEVNLPLSNLVKKEDIAFQMDFNVKEECVKNIEN